MQFRHCVLSAYLWRSLPRIPSDFTTGGTVLNTLYDLSRARAMAKRWGWLYDDGVLTRLVQGREAVTGVSGAGDLLC
jgi:hypothetical protein